MNYKDKIIKSLLWFKVKDFNKNMDKYKQYRYYPFYGKPKDIYYGYHDYRIT